MPDHAIDGLRILLKGGTAISSIEDAFSIQLSLTHGHVAAVLGTIENIGLRSNYLTNMRLYPCLLYRDALMALALFPSF